jgi:hypothetical protein
MIFQRTNDILSLTLIVLVNSIVAGLFASFPGAKFSHVG